MSIHLNAFPLEIPDTTLGVCIISYDKERLDALRASHHVTHAFRRQGESILVFSQDGQYPVTGKSETIKLKDNFGIFSFLVKEGLTRHLVNLGRRPRGFNPIELVSEKPEDNLLAPILGQDYPFQIFVKYTIDTRIIQDRPCLIIDSATRTMLRFRGSRSFNPPRK